MEREGVLLYQGGLSLVKKSGVGSALRHQEQALKQAEVTYGIHGDYPIVHLNTIFPDSYLMALKARKEGKKVVYHGHSTMEDFRRSFIGSNVLAPLFQKWICRCYNLGDIVVTPTAYSRRILEGYGLKVPVIDVSNGVDTAFFQKSPEQKMRFRMKYGLSMRDQVVLSVGLPLERKGILEFIQMAENYPEYQFFWFGGINPLLVRWDILRAIRQAPKNCHFPGYVGRSELRDAYGGSDLFLFLSSEETEGIVLLEALAMELPILARPIGAYEGWLIDGENACLREGFPKLRDTLWEMLEERKWLYPENGRKTAMERDLKITGRRLATVYRSLYNEINSKGETENGSISDFDRGR